MKTIKISKQQEKFLLFALEYVGCDTVISKTDKKTIAQLVKKIDNAQEE